jgi:hypothetical protein
MKKIKVPAVMAMQELDVRSEEGNHEQGNNLDMNSNVTGETGH